MHNTLQLVNLSFKVLDLTLEVLVDVDKTLLFFVQDLVRLILTSNLDKLMFELLFHSYDCVLVNLCLLQAQNDFFTKHRVQLVTLA